MDIDFSKQAEQHVKTIKKQASNILDLNKALSEKSAEQFSNDISTGKLYDEMKPGKVNKVIDL